MKIIDYRFGNTIPYLTKRHLKSMYRSLTIKKMFNAMLFAFEFRVKRKNTAGFPLYIKIEPTNICDHSCPQCATLNWRPKGYMQWDLYKRIIDNVKPWCMRNCLYGQGESFLHPDIYKMIRYSEDMRCPVSISTNFNNINKDGIQSILDSGLDYIIICIDGATQETHSRYRRGGNLGVVLDNLQMLASLREKGSYTKPTIEIQTASFDYIKDEIPRISRMVEERGADLHMIRENMYNDKVQRAPRSSCPYLWGSLFYTWEGKMFPCEEFCNEQHIAPIPDQNKRYTPSRNHSLQVNCRDYVTHPENGIPDTSIRCSWCHHYR